MSEMKTIESMFYCASEPDAKLFVEVDQFSKSTVILDIITELPSRTVDGRTIASVEVGVDDLPRLISDLQTMLANLTA